MKKLIILFLCSFLNIVQAEAQLSDSINRHIIIAVDGAMPQYTTILTSNSVRNLTQQFVNQFHLSQDDYISIAVYQIDISNPDFNKFAWVPNDLSGRKTKWLPYNGNIQELGNWENIVFTQPATQISKYKASFQTASKQYVIKSLALQNSNEEIKGANETVVIVLSDDKINGSNNDFKFEWPNIATLPNSGLAPYKNEVFKTLEGFNNTYHFSQKNVGGPINGDFSISVFSLKPNVIPSIQSISNIPAQLPIVRIKGGYGFNIEIEPTNDKYEIKKIELTLNKSNKKYTAIGSTINELIDKSDLAEGDTATMRVWVKYKDGIYNGIIMNPYDTEYCAGLTMTQAIIFKDDAKVYGLLPVWDIFWWFKPNDIQAIVVFWDVTLAVILTILLTIIVIKLYKKLMIYRPNNKDIKLTPINEKN